MQVLSKVRLLAVAAGMMIVPLVFAQAPAAPNQAPKKDRATWQMADRQMGPGMERSEQGRQKQMHRPRPEFMLPRLVSNLEIRKKLGITDEQAEKIRTQSSEFRKTEIRNHAEIKVKKVELRDLLAVEKPDRAAIDSKLQEISALRLTQEKAAIAFRLDMREALTPEQRQKLKEMRQEHRGGPGQHGEAPQSSSSHG